MMISLICQPPLPHLRIQLSFENLIIHTYRMSDYSNIPLAVEKTRNNEQNIFNGKIAELKERSDHGTRLTRELIGSHR